MGNKGHQVLQTAWKLQRHLYVVMLSPQGQRQDCKYFMEGQGRRDVIQAGEAESMNQVRRPERRCSLTPRGQLSSQLRSMLNRTGNKGLRVRFRIYCQHPGLQPPHVHILADQQANHHLQVSRLHALTAQHSISHTVLRTHPKTHSADKHKNLTLASDIREQ